MGDDEVINKVDDIPGVPRLQQDEGGMSEEAKRENEPPMSQEQMASQLSCAMELVSSQRRQLEEQQEILETIEDELPQMIQIQSLLRQMDYNNPNIRVQFLKGAFGEKINCSGVMLAALDSIRAIISPPFNFENFTFTSGEATKHLIRLVRKDDRIFNLPNSTYTYSYS